MNSFFFFCLRKESSTSDTTICSIYWHVWHLGMSDFPVDLHERCTRSSDRDRLNLVQLIGCQADLMSCFPRPDNQTQEEGARPHGPHRGEGDHVGAWRGGRQLRWGDIRDTERAQWRLQWCGWGHGQAQRPEQWTKGQGTWTQRLAGEESFPSLRPSLTQPAPTSCQGHTCQIPQKWRWGSQSRG